MMTNEEKQIYKKLFSDELEKCIDFWVKNGYDKVNGGMYTCLDRTGRRYSEDKSVWMQGRAGWTFARLCNQYGSKPEWLEISKSCCDFLDKYCIDKKDARMYFTVTADGKPIRKRRYYYSEVFYICAQAEYSKASGDKEALEKARKYFDFLHLIYLDRANDPFKITPKVQPETRQGRSLADTMTLLNVGFIMRDCDPENAEKYTKYIDIYMHNLFTYHHKPEMNMLLETVGLNGEFQDTTTAGRVINPGHDIECSWFLLAEAEYRKDEALVNKAEKIFWDAFNRGWDEEYEGILYFVDAYGFPPEQYEHDMKLWWVHNETIIATLMFYNHTGDEKYIELFRKITEYSFRVFSDPENGEWYGYLRRDGKPTQPACKGSTYKGPFHLPRMLMAVDNMLGI